MDTELPPGRFRLVVRHAGGLFGSLPPSAQWVSLATSGDAPLPPRFTRLILSPGGTKLLARFTSAPGEYFHLCSRERLESGQWSTNRLLRAEGADNAVLLNVDDRPRRFWCLLRQRGAGSTP